MKKVLLFLVLLGNLIVTGHAAIPATERAALISLYTALNGDNWHVKTSWKTIPLHTDGFSMPGTENSWFGISVISIDGQDHVERINLQNNYLVGTLPDVFSNFPYLEGVFMSSNQMSGSLPSSLAMLTRIYYIDLHDNLLSGTISNQFFLSSSLLELNLSYNNFSGTLPTTVAANSALGTVILSHNALSGTIPSALGNLDLSILKLGYNNFTGEFPLFVTQMPNLYYLELSGIPFNCEIPKELSSMTNLQALYLSKCGLVGKIPKELCLIRYLNVLDLSFNNIEGNLPSNINALGALQHLTICDNNMSGNLPDTLDVSSFITLSMEVNNFYETNPEQYNALLAKDQYWARYQTTPPVGIKAERIDAQTIKVSWSKRDLHNLDGYYQVYIGTQSGIYQNPPVIKLLNETTHTFSGLIPNQQYYFAIKVVTPVSETYRQSHEHISEFSFEVTTAPVNIFVEAILNNAFADRLQIFVRASGDSQISSNDLSITWNATDYNSTSVIQYSLDAMLWGTPSFFNEFEYTPGSYLFQIQYKGETKATIDYSLLAASLNSNVIFNNLYVTNKKETQQPIVITSYINALKCPIITTDKAFIVKMPSNSLITIHNPYGQKGILLYDTGIEWQMLESRVDDFKITSSGKYLICNDENNVFIPKIKETVVYQNFPNPFNPETDIYYELVDSGNVVLSVYDMKGRKVATLVNEYKTMGQYTIHWNGRDDRYRELPSGVYYSVLEVNGKRYTKKMVLLK